MNGMQRKVMGDNGRYWEAMGDSGNPWQADVGNRSNAGSSGRCRQHTQCRRYWEMQAAQAVQAARGSQARSRTPPALSSFSPPPRHTTPLPSHAIPTHSRSPEPPGPPTAAAWLPAAPQGHSAVGTSALQDTPAAMSHPRSRGAAGPPVPIPVPIPVSLRALTWAVLGPFPCRPHGCWSRYNILIGAVCVIHAVCGRKGGQ